MLLSCLYSEERMSSMSASPSSSCVLSESMSDEEVRDEDCMRKGEHADREEEEREITARDEDEVVTA